jgi:hypothetical protein
VRKSVYSVGGIAATVAIFARQRWDFLRLTAAVLPRIRVTSNHVTAYDTSKNVCNVVKTFQKTAENNR